ncbi:MAG: PD-(D/E)XK nuclease family transposase [Paludibacteraceae bacterium]|nr:PD-(D/E)XK nuclease family transposase [Paludibacteraceae bacterium]
MRSGYVNLKTDWGFKHLMGHEPQMRSFLNSLLSDEYVVIKRLTFENVEVLSDRKDGRGVIFDIFCTTDSGDKIIVEMQNYSQLFFKTRANYYPYSLITKVLGRGVDWNNRFRIHTMRKVHIKSDDDIVTKQITGLNL